MGDSELSERSSLSEKLCLRFLVVGDAGEGARVVASGSEVAAGSCGVVVVWAENSGEREAWGIGMDGRAEVTGVGRRVGGVSSARTKAGEGYPHCCEYRVFEASLPLYGSILGAKRDSSGHGAPGSWRRAPAVARECIGTMWEVRGVIRDGERVRCHRGDRQVMRC